MMKDREMQHFVDLQHVELNKKEAAALELNHSEVVLPAASSMLSKERNGRCKKGEIEAVFFISLPGCWFETFLFYHIV